MILAGLGNLFVDGKLEISIPADAPRGDSFFGLGTEEVKVTVGGLKAGQPVALELRMNTSSIMGSDSLVKCRGGIRLGATRAVQAVAAMAEAVELAKSSDGIAVHHLAHVVLFLYIAHQLP